MVHINEVNKMNLCTCTDVVDIIVSFLDYKDCISLKGTSKQMYEAVKSNKSIAGKKLEFIFEAVYGVEMNAFEDKNVAMFLISPFVKKFDFCYEKASQKTTLIPGKKDQYIMQVLIEDFKKRCKKYAFVGKFYILPVMCCYIVLIKNILRTQKRFMPFVFIVSLIHESLDAFILYRNRFKNIDESFEHSVAMLFNDTTVAFRHWQA